MQAITDRSAPMTGRPADALVDRAASGDTAAFEQLYRENNGRIYALCLRMTGRPAEAEELTQQAFIRAWEKLHTFRGEASFSTWMHRLAANVVLSHRRSEMRRRARTVEQEDLSFHADLSDRTDRGPAVDLEEAIAALPEGARTIFVLYDVEGYRHDEIAQLTGVASGTSKAQLHRARRLLREALNQ